MQKFQTGRFKDFLDNMFVQLDRETDELRGKNLNCVKSNFACLKREDLIKTEIQSFCAEKSQDSLLNQVYDYYEDAWKQTYIKGVRYWMNQFDKRLQLSNEQSKSQLREVEQAIKRIQKSHPQVSQTQGKRLSKMREHNQFRVGSMIEKQRNLIRELSQICQISKQLKRQ